MADYTELVSVLRECSKLGTRYGMAAIYMEKAADAIEELQSTVEYYAEAGQELRRAWIPVTERLPGREWVLCKCRANIHEVLSLRDGYWYHDPQHKYMSGFVTHWMPLPEPPREEQT